MLVLTREIDETIEIGGDVILKVLEVIKVNGRHKVRLGFLAPPEIKIWRSEVADKIRANGRES